MFKWLQNTKESLVDTSKYASELEKKHVTNFDFKKFSPWTPFGLCFTFICGNALVTEVEKRLTIRTQAAGWVFRSESKGLSRCISFLWQLQQLPPNSVGGTQIYYLTLLEVGSPT